MVWGWPCAECCGSDLKMLWRRGWDNVCSFKWFAFLCEKLRAYVENWGRFSRAPFSPFKGMTFFTVFWGKIFSLEL
ncbi:hypothetical protein CEV08_08640 [Bartonella tribocorum]|uniref:Uncharacterized protein n=1 Tax=Bartonella tribocorum TaxID=85701 RepID=A0A2N9Y8Q3_9HYPH|nr:hypothetical protein CEV08_08640 [Bartonella tribocorum]